MGDNRMGDRRMGDSRMTPAADALAAWAGYLAAMGWPVFPLAPGGKHPANWHRAADCPGTGLCAGAGGFLLLQTHFIYFNSLI